MKKYFCKTTEDSLKDFDVTLNGLTNAKVTEIINTVGENILNEKKKKSILSIFIEQFKDLLVIINKKRLLI